MAVEPHRTVAPAPGSIPDPAQDPFAPARPARTIGHAPEHRRIFLGGVAAIVVLLGGVALIV